MTNLPPPPPPPPPQIPPPPPYGGAPAAAAPVEGFVVPADRYAGFGDRLLALILDLIAYGWPSVVLGIAAGVVFGIGSDPDGDVDSWAAITGTILAIAAAVVGVLLLIRWMRRLGRETQSWGAKTMGIRLVDKRSGGPIGSWQAFGRYLFAYFISSALCYLGYLWMLWDRDRQTWHDKVTSSIVVKA